MVAYTNVTYVIKFLSTPKIQIIYEVIINAKYSSMLSNAQVINKTMKVTEHFNAYSKTHYYKN